jgi:hypothetical protein
MVCCQLKSANPHIEAASERVTRPCICGEKLPMAVTPPDVGGVIELFNNVVHPAATPRAFSREKYAVPPFVGIDGLKVTVPISGRSEKLLKLTPGPSYPVGP